MGKKSNQLLSPGSSAGKRIKVHDAVFDSTPAESRKPTFSFYYLQADYCITRCEAKEKAKFADTLRKLSTMTWAQLRQNNRHKLGYEKIEKSAIKVGLPPCIKDDTTLIAFRFAGKAPMVGYREDEVFHVIWLDRKFTLYEHG